MKEKQNTENEQSKQQKTLFSIPITSVLMIIILSALCGITVKECKRADLRLKRDKYKYERFMDSVKKVNQQSADIVFNTSIIRQ